MISVMAASGQDCGIRGRLVRRERVRGKASNAAAAGTFGASPRSSAQQRRCNHWPIRLYAATPCGRGDRLVATMNVERPMNWDQIEGNWKQMTGKVKEQWGKLTDDELTQIAGNREQLEGKIQERYGYTKDQAKKQVDDYFNRI
jgi:uncharacterized protein YjbJ (UPF0337 family)